MQSQTTWFPPPPHSPLRLAPLVSFGLPSPWFAPPHKKKTGFPWIFLEPENCWWWFLIISGHRTKKLLSMGIEILGLAFLTKQCVLTWSIIISVAAIRFLVFPPNSTELLAVLSVGSLLYPGTCLYLCWTSHKVTIQNVMIWWLF